MAKIKNSTIKEPRINHEITGHTNVRLIYKEKRNETTDNDFNKVVSWKEAIFYSKTKKLDLIEINHSANPPVILLDNYSKYLYELKKQHKQQYKKACDLKEIQLSVNISEHDIKIKLNKALNFIKDGDKVKLHLKMKGRELTRREESKKSFYVFVDEMLKSGFVSVENEIKDEGRDCFVILKRK